jgi:hypothetical protein
LYRDSGANSTIGPPFRPLKSGYPRGRDSSIIPGGMSLPSRNKDIMIGLWIIVWLVTAWLLYPLVVLDTVDMTNAKAFLFRSAAGITVMIILFGKAIFDLLFSGFISRKPPVLTTILLTLYTLAIGSGIILMIVRIIIIFLKNRTPGFPF